MLESEIESANVLEYRDGLNKKSRNVFDVLIEPESFLYSDAELAENANVTVDIFQKLKLDQEFMTAVNAAAELNVAQQLFRVKQAQAFYALQKDNVKDREKYLERYDPTESDMNGNGMVTIINDMGM